MLLDKFYTNPDVAQYCVNLVKLHINIHKDDMIIEPSAGSGVFIPYIKNLCKHYTFYDIKPDHPGIKKQNFLTLKHVFDRPIHVIGNPPFGRKLSSAIKFIKKCDELRAKSISFILPRSFKKSSVKKSVPLHYHLKYQIDLPPYSFNRHNRPFDIPTVFQIWVYKNRLRKKHKILYPNNFYKFTNNDVGDISIRRVGYNLGKSYKCSILHNPNSHYFIKLNGNSNIDQTIHDLNKIKFNKHSNTGSLSMSKQFLISKLNQIIKN